MGRSLGSPNCNEYHWHFFIYDPSNHDHVIWSKMYITIYQMHEDLSPTFTLHQLKSYAAKRRNCPKNIEIKRICIPVKEC